MKLGERFYKTLQSCWLYKVAPKDRRWFKMNGYKLVIFAFCVCAALGGLKLLPMDVPSPATLLARCAPEFYRSLRGTINADAVIKVGDVVGICSLIVTHILSSLREKELGFRYSELLPELRSGYQHLFPIQVCALVVSMWCAEVSALEAGLWAVGVVLVGNIIQWRTLTDLILDSKRRTETAIRLWQKRIRESKDENQLGVVIRDMARQLCYDVRGSYGGMEEALAKGMDRYLALRGESAVWSSWRDVLRELAGFWTCILGDRPEHDRTLATVAILQHCDDRNEMPLCAGYFLWYHNTFMTKVDSLEAANRAVAGMVEKKDLLVQRFAGAGKKDCVAQYAQQITATLVRMYFLTGHSDLLGGLGDKFSPLAPEDRNILDALAGIFFTKESCKRIWSTVVESMFERDGARSSEGEEEQTCAST